MTPIEFIVILAGGGFAAVATGWLTRRFNLRRPNFLGRLIPSMAGLVVLLACTWIYAFEWFWQGLNVGSAAAFFLVAFGFGLLGALDDLAGDRSVTGIRGHFGALAHRRLTTGAAKAIGGGGVSLVAGWLVGYPSVWHSLLAAALVALSANALNLLDVRPGRCLFGFFCGCCVIVAVLTAHHAMAVGFLLYIAIAIALVLYPLDAGGLVMLGDTGSNSLGAILGLAEALYLGRGWQCGLVLALVLFHLWTEKYSLSKAIDRNPLLRGLDRKIGIR